MSVPGTHDSLIRQIAELPENWHGAGTIEEEVLRAFVRHAASADPINSSVETGTGRSTLLLSQISESHVVFAKDDTGDGDSLQRVTTSPILRAENARFVVGPTQRTLPEHDFSAPIDLAFIDGPHAYPFPDLEYWVLYPHIRPGGLLVVDDIQILTIHNLYRVLAADSMWRRLEVVNNCAFFARTEAPLIDPLRRGLVASGLQPAVRADRH